MSLHTPDPSPLCDAPTEPDPDAEREQADWEAWDEAREQGIAVASPDSVRRYSAHLTRQHR